MNSSKPSAMTNHAPHVGPCCAASVSRLSSRLIVVLLAAVVFLAAASSVRAQEPPPDPNAGKPGFCPPSAYDLAMAEKYEKWAQDELKLARDYDQLAEKTVPDINKAIANKDKEGEKSWRDSHDEHTADRDRLGKQSEEDTARAKALRAWKPCPPGSQAIQQDKDQTSSASASTVCPPTSFGAKEAAKHFKLSIEFLARQRESDERARRAEQELQKAIEWGNRIDKAMKEAQQEHEREVIEQMRAMYYLFGKESEEEKARAQTLREGFPCLPVSQVQVQEPQPDENYGKPGFCPPSAEDLKMAEKYAAKAQVRLKAGLVEKSEEDAAQAKALRAWKPCAPHSQAEQASTRDISVFGGYFYMRPGGEEVKNLNGWRAGLAVQVSERVSLGADFTDGYGSSSIDPPGGPAVKTNLHRQTYMAGVQVDILPGSRSWQTDIHPALQRQWNAFVEAQLGAAHDSNRISSAGMTSSSSAMAFAMKVGGGLDRDINEHFGVRLFQFDYQPTHFGGAWQNNFGVSTGLVVHFGGNR